VLADELHFGRTAQRLGISQPGVSEAVRVLESRLGVKVFDRTSRRVQLTPAGEGLKRDLVPALAALEQALAETSSMSRAVRGLLRIGFVLTTEGPPLSRLVTAFQARSRSGICLRCHSGWSGAPAGRTRASAPSTRPRSP
jgi:DNA-binding transcriptional LysR family regulator